MDSKIKWKDPINGLTAFFTEESYSRMVKDETFENKLLSSITALKLKSRLGVQSVSDKNNDSSKIHLSDQGEEFHLPNALQYDVSAFKKSGLHEKSTLNKHEQRKYIDLLLHFRQKQMNSETQNLSNTEKKELALFESLQKRVSAEQARFLANLREVAIDQSIYAFLSPEGRRYFQEKWQEKQKIVESLPNQYVNVKLVLPLTVQMSPQTKVATLQFVKTLAELGAAPKITLPILIPGEKKIIPTEYEKVSSQYPTSHDQHYIEGKFNHEVCSKDSNCEHLARMTFSHIVVCTSVLQCLVNNHAPDYCRSWEIPFSVKVHEIDYQGKTVKQKVIYFDKPLLTKNNSNRDKNTLFHKYAFRTYIAKTNRKNVPAGREFPKSSVPVSRSSVDVARSSSTASCVDDLFGDACMNDMETFGTEQSNMSADCSTAICEEGKKEKKLPSNVKDPSNTDNGDREITGNSGAETLTDHSSENSSEDDIKPNFCDSVKTENTKSINDMPGTGNNLQKGTRCKSVNELNKNLFGSESDTEMKSEEAEIKRKNTTENVRDKEMELCVTTKELHTSDTSSFSEISDIELNENVDKISPHTESTLTSHSANAVSTCFDDQKSNSEFDTKQIEITNESHGKSGSQLMGQSYVGPFSVAGDSSDSESNLVIDINESDDNLKPKKKRVEEIFSPSESMDENFVCNPTPVKVVNLAKKDRNVPNRNTSNLFKQKWRLHRLSSDDAETDSTTVKSLSSRVKLRSGKVLCNRGSADELSSTETVSQSDSESVFTPPRKARKMEEILSPDSSTINEAPEEFPVKLIPLEWQDYGQIIMMSRQKKKRHRKLPVEKQCARKLRSHSSQSGESGGGDESEPLTSDTDTGESVSPRRSARLRTLSASSDKAPTIKKKSEETKEQNDQRHLMELKRKRGRLRKTVLPPRESLKCDSDEDETVEGKVGKNNLPNQEIHPSVSESLLMAEESNKTVKDRASIDKSKTCLEKPSNKGKPVAKQNPELDCEKTNIRNTENVSKSQNKGKVKICKSKDNTHNPTSSKDLKTEPTEIHKDQTTITASKVLAHENDKQKDVLIDRVTARSRSERKAHSKQAILTKEKAEDVTKECKVPENFSEKPKDSSQKKVRKGKVRQTSSDGNPLDSILGKSSSPDSKNQTTTEMPNSGLKEPVCGQVAYSLWKFSGLSMIIRTSNHGMVRDACQNFQGHIVPKLEYQLKHGMEQVSIEETSRAWIACYVKPFSRLIRGRIGACTSELMMLESLDLNQILMQASNFNPVAALCSLHNIFMNLYNLAEGDYLLYHEPGEPNCQVRQSIGNHTRGTYDLHVNYLGRSDTQVKKHATWYPIDTSIILPHQIKSGRIPATFEPEDFDAGKQPGKRAGRKRKNKNKKK